MAVLRVDQQASTAVDLAEFDALRQEINSRLGISYTIIAIDLAALGAGISVVGRFEHALSGLAIVSSLLWLFWIDNSMMINALGAYIALNLAARMSRELSTPALSWERFQRQVLARGHETTTGLSTIGRRPPRGSLLRSARVDWYTFVLFGVTPPLLLCLDVLTGSRQASADKVTIGVAAMLTLALWARGVVDFIGFNRFVRSCHQAILGTQG